MTSLARLLKIHQPDNRPLIAVPITLGPEDKFGPLVTALRQENPDVVEWRADFIADAFSQEVIWQQVKAGARAEIEEQAVSPLSEASLLGKLDDARQEFLSNWPAINAQLIKELVRSIFDDFGHFPIILTYRTKGQGGLGELPPVAVATFLVQALKSGFPFAAVDVEDTLDEELKAKVIETAESLGVPVILSYHDFANTPADLSQVLLNMTKQRVAVVKLAVMPKTADDVNRLLVATELVASQIDQPLITMAMGLLGVTSRVEGYEHGSQLTFATLGDQWSSAPGQLTIQELLSKWR